MKRVKNKKINTKNASLFLMAFILFSVFAYVYSYQSSISYASSIQQIENKISNLQSEISEVESVIVQKRRTIDKKLAIESGFISINNQIFIKRNSATALNEKTN